MATIIKRKKKETAQKQPLIKKFKKFKLALEFDSRNDAMDFASAVQQYSDDISKEVTELAYR